jgi:hypothetical protein
MRGVGQLLRRSTSPAPPSAGLEPFLDHRQAESKSLKQGRSDPIPSDQTEDDVLSADGIMPQAPRLSPCILERPLRLGAQRVRVKAGWRMRAWWLTQSGLASSISMMGMPSSTG